MYKGVSTRIGFPRINDSVGYRESAITRYSDTRIHPRISSARVFGHTSETEKREEYDAMIINFYLSQAFIVVHSARENSVPELNQSETKVTI